MVVFVDYESEDDDHFSSQSAQHSQSDTVHTQGLSHSNDHRALSEPENKTRGDEDVHTNGRLFASVLACYPASLSLAGQLDLNDLYSLSFTCRKVHEGLSQFARQLRTHSLRCVNDLPPRTSEEEVDSIIFQEALHEIAGYGISSPETSALPVPFSPGGNQFHISQNSVLGLSGKVSTCARDLVAPCRKCGTIVCRNCSAKPPSDRCLPNRYRRLCRTCLDTPLVDHLRRLSVDQDFHDSPPASSASSARSVRSISSSDSQSDPDDGKSESRKLSFTSPIFLRDPCTCATRGVYLCQPCGQSLNSADTTYKRVWTWRSRYSTHIGGGLGTGLGLGNQGQKCGRGEHCLERGAAGVCWVEIECSEARAHNHGRDNGFSISRSSTPLAGDYDGEFVIVNRPGYLSQELEGIGGVLKKKVKKRVKVGATVYEYDDERETGKYLLRESSGQLRSWCGWCSRVCPGEVDETEIDRVLNQRT